MEPWYSIRILHGELGDPFRIMPMASAASSLGEGLHIARQNFNEHMGQYGVSKRYWTEPCELIYDEIGIIIGNSFVLSQVAISQAISIFTKIRESCSDKNRYPKSKNNILCFKLDVSRPLVVIFIILFLTFFVLCNCSRFSEHY